MNDLDSPHPEWRGPLSLGAKLGVEHGVEITGEVTSMDVAPHDGGFLAEGPAIGDTQPSAKESTEVDAPSATMSAEQAIASAISTSAAGGGAPPVSVIHRVTHTVVPGTGNPQKETTEEFFLGLAGWQSGPVQEVSLGVETVECLHSVIDLYGGLLREAYVTAARQLSVMRFNAMHAALEAVSSVLAGPALAPGSQWKTASGAIVTVGPQWAADIFTVSSAKGYEYMVDSRGVPVIHSAYSDVYTDVREALLHLLEKRLVTNVTPADAKEPTP
jgi:hypothetical protein